MASRKQKLESQTAARKMEQNLRKPVNRWMASQPGLIMADFNKLTTIPTDVEFAVYSFPAWEVIQESGIEAVKPAITKAFGEGGKISFAMIEFMPSPFDPLKRESVIAVDDLCSKLVTDVTDETKKAINFVVKDGLEKGKGWKQIGRELRPKVGLNERMVRASANFEEKLITARPDLSQKQIYERVGAYERKMHRQRNEMIARTEAKRAMSEGQVRGFEEARVQTLRWFALVDHCEDCQAVNGNEYPIQATHGMQPLHPRCRCGWLPVLAS